MSRLLMVLLFVYKSAQTLSLKDNLYPQKYDYENKVQMFSLDFINDDPSLLSSNIFLNRETKGNFETTNGLKNKNDMRKCKLKPDKSKTSRLKTYQYSIETQMIRKLYESNKKNYSYLKTQFNARVRTTNNSVLHRERRSINSKSALCTFPMGKLVEVKNKVKSVFSQISEQTPTCEESEASSDNCVKWLKLIQCAATHITRGIREVRIVNRLTIWEDVYRTIKFEYEQGEITRNSLSTELQESFDLLRTELLGVKRILDDIKSAFNEDQMNLCIENIRTGNIENAISHFKQLKSNSALIEITRISYSNHGKLMNLKNIVNFGYSLPTCNQNLIVYVTLFDLVKTSDGLSSPYIIVFHKRMERCMKGSLTEMSLRTSAEDIFNSWANSIRNSDYTSFLPFLKENAIEIRDYYPQIIEKVYESNLDNAKITLNFIRDTPYIEDECLCLAALFNIMKINGDLNSYQTLMLAFRVKELMDMQNYSTVREDVRNKTEFLKDSFRSSVKGIIWNGSSCTVKNKLYKEYLYAAGDVWAYDRDRRNVFTWRKQEEKVIQGFWSITPVHNGEYFNFKNTVHNEYLYAAADELKHDSDRRNVFTWRPGTNVLQDEWQLIPVSNGDYFRILSKTFSEYLYSPIDSFARDSERRRVFTWGGGNEFGQKMEWEIHC